MRILIAVHEVWSASYRTSPLGNTYIVDEVVILKLNIKRVTSEYRGCFTLNEATIHFGVVLRLRMSGFVHLCTPSPSVCLNVVSWKTSHYLSCDWGLVLSDEVLLHDFKCTF
jgi:hypothetical protein